VEAKKLSLDDDQGQPHSYLIGAHPASEGLRLASRLFALVGAPFGKLLDVLVSSGEEADVDLGGISSQLSRALLEADMPALVKDLLRYTHRDGVDLANGVMLDTIYQANYGELADALAEVVEVNGFARFFSRLAKRAGRGMGGLVGQLSPLRPGSSSAG
jgi:hypothetical protein